jgi:hypothetical protein
MPNLLDRACLQHGDIFLIDDKNNLLLKQKALVNDRGFLP